MGGNRKLLADAIIAKAKKRKIVKIIFKGASGKKTIGGSYKDRLVLTTNSISYHFVPHKYKYIDSDVGEVCVRHRQKWFYETNSPRYNKNYYRTIIGLTYQVLCIENPEIFPDEDSIEVIMVFSDKSKVKKKFWVPKEHGYFHRLKVIVREVIPSAEKMPVVLDEDDRNLD